ncbi:hypothetical protein AGABI1DRAFT_63367 [Agaricus bisporus var. burnettii JB137-S8]|uniref:Structural maintenance of chromosomes protein n=1 Tax=Agaricus bisporus var. burnettii (strain JB137-S8 / ATCC MYA-4627 / FGSC 10392) TaxID=597362 RepID=K5WZN8_AGABU|nr:uncharacterized protein AGABI1DRAFT_63367 [Agaricus bisporus var. burnettii JB137-S8]EKM76313.1 hypothetical protein AGABI1DRAFT_63367 [Agaricus bisporus var. burnettii JB137-S8]
MRIEELIVDGFKSYPNRTQISGWDPSFNAITGLNGSGKSNILDAICFVLGITNVSAMRAQTQQDLIYKRGQAGITKASVTIVFDNTDTQNKDQMPAGFANQPQITVTRQFSLPNTTKWLLNGHKTTQQAILNMFQGVQLNINNPNFLIMQGRITKVLNMRPQEILGMIEEAAGTKMFESQKDRARKTMGKKEKRVNEINEQIREEIAPKLNKLRGEKKVYIEFTKAEKELEKIGRVLRAWEYSEAQDRVAEKEVEIDEAKKEKKGVEADMKKASKECQQAEKDLNDVVKKREAEMKKGGKLARLKDAAEELGKQMVKVRTQAEIKDATIEEEEKALLDIQNEIKNLEEAITNETQKLAQMTEAHKSNKDKYASLEADVQKSEELLQTLLTGVSSKQDKTNTGGGYMGQLAEAKAQLAQGKAEEEQSKVKLSMREKELVELKRRMKEFEREAGEGQKKLKDMNVVVERIREKLGKSRWNQVVEEQLEKKLTTLRQRVRELMERRERVKQSLPRLNFEYSDPYQGFDRRKIKGYVAQLTSLDERHYDKATALEVAAGGKLFNVIVEDENVGNQLLKNGRLRKRVTMIPLTKIKSYPIPQNKIDIANRTAPGKVHTALSLVGYPEELSKAMSYVFGSTFICSDAETAKRITFHQSIHTRSVTIEGDVYDPQGSLSGGSAPSGNRILLDVQKLLEVESELREVKRELEEVEEEGRRSEKVREEWRAGKRDLEIREHELKLVEEQVGGSNASRIAADVNEAEENIKQLKEAVRVAKEKQQNAQVECAKLEKDMNEFKNNKEGKTDELKKEIAKKKAALQKHSVIVKTQQKEHQTATLELEQQEKDIEVEKKKFEEAKAHVSTLKKELVRMSEEVEAYQAKYQEAERKYQEEQDTLGRFDSELKSLEEVIRARKSSITDAQVMIQEVDHKILSLGKEKTTNEHRMEHLEKSYEWIVHDKHLFGQANTQYDFSTGNIDQLRAKAQELEKSQAASKKNLNPKAIAMIEQLEKREASLQKMLATVVKDREKIEAGIEEIDAHKRDALQKTWDKVSADFGSIFGELLPGNFAKLQPPEGQDLMDGLEVKVRLGSVWKQSLTELSGGQRSLIALSLIMALLQFKPAPMYILDEIDAALDLSHTQNIGQLFRTRFKGSQFIVVSLKEGLFTNANVLFKARFVDGTSVVEQTTQRSTSDLYN